MIYVDQRYWLVFFFFFGIVFVWVWFQGEGGPIELIWKCLKVKKMKVKVAQEMVFSFQFLEIV